MKKNKKLTVGENSKNLLIEGDNLEAPKALMPFYYNKVECIYIDPPYNTGNEKWIYNDRVNSPQIKSWINKVVGLEGKVVGIDKSKDFIDYAKRFCDESNALFITGDVENLGKYLGNQKFDVAVILASWFWIKEKEKFCVQTKNCLKPDGRFAISISSDNLNDSKTKEFYWIYRKELKDAVLEISPSADLSNFDSLPIVDGNFINRTAALVNGSGFYLQSQHEVERTLTLKDKLFTYNNPARTEWVGDFPCDTRLSIIRQALSKTADKFKGSTIKRHTLYLVFGLDKEAK